MTLRDWCREQRLSIPAFARLIKKSPNTVRGWVYYGRVPRPPMMRKIKRVTNGAVAPADWY
jgi:DNA-binding transcriptional regulator YiaG